MQALGDDEVTDMDIEKRQLIRGEAMLELKRDEGWFPSAASSVIAGLERIDCTT